MCVFVGAAFPFGTINGLRFLLPCFVFQALNVSFCFIREVAVI